MKRSKNRGSRIRRIICFVLMHIGMMLLFGYMMYTTQPASPDNCEVLTGKVEKLELRKEVHSDDILAFTIGKEDSQLILQLHNYPDKESPNLMKSIQMEDGDLTATVRKGYYYLIPLLQKEKGVVDLRSNSSVYYDVNNYNSYQETQRKHGIIGISVIEVMFLAVTLLYFYVEYIGNPKRSKNEKGKPIRGRFSD